MRNISNSPIFIRLGNRARGPEGTTVGKVRNITISNVSVMGVNPKFSVLIVGIPGYSIENIRFDNLHIIYDGGGKKEDVKIVPPENEKAYPSPHRFGKMPYMTKNMFEYFKIKRLAEEKYVNKISMNNRKFLVNFNLIRVDNEKLQNIVLNPV